MQAVLAEVRDIVRGYRDMRRLSARLGRLQYETLRLPEGPRCSAELVVHVPPDSIAPGRQVRVTCAQAAGHEGACLGVLAREGTTAVRHWTAPFNRPPAHSRCGLPHPSEHSLCSEPEGHVGLHRSLVLHGRVRSKQWWSA
jgi:hypothetical protein